MLKIYYEELVKQKNIRENLSNLRSIVKDMQQKEELCAIVAEKDAVTPCLVQEDAKTRKNAALLLGDLQWQPAVGALVDAYNKEETLFVKSAYLTALAHLDAAGHLAFFRQRLAELVQMEIPEQDKKHIYAEIHALEKIISAADGRKKHTFTGLKTNREFVLAANHELRKVTLAETAELSAEVRRKVSLHPLGVLVVSKELRPFLKLRTYRELLFPIHMNAASNQTIGKKPAEAAAAVWNSDLMDLLQESHKGEGAFYFRVELKTRMEMDKRSAFAKKFASELEHLSKMALINSPEDYEAEIRLMETKEGEYVPFLKLYTLQMTRFSYRKNAIAASIHPSLAAMLVQLAKPYLKENAQILDPFCGVGTMLIERDIKVPAREIYGIDIFGDAVRLGRENAAAAGEKINFINRNYFDFKHHYLFDEIITNMPVRGKKTKEEMDQLYADFFAKTAHILAPRGMIILYTNEEGFIKKQLRLHPGYRLKQEHCVREKEHFYLYIIQFMG